MSLASQENVLTRAWLGLAWLERAVRQYAMHANSVNTYIYSITFDARAPRNYQVRKAVIGRRNEKLIILVLRRNGKKEKKKGYIYF